MNKKFFLSYKSDHTIYVIPSIENTMKKFTLLVSNQNNVFNFVVYYRYFSLFLSLPF